MVQLMGRRILGRFCIGFLLLVQTSGCGMLPEAPSWQRAGQVAARAVLDPRTWGPLAGAAVFWAGDFDEPLSDWAIDHTPVFGSPRGADDASDWLLAGAAAAYGGTMLAAPAGAADRWNTRFDQAATGAQVLLATGGTTLLLKETVGRERPDGSEDASFPSLHASAATAFSTLTSRNLDHLPLTAGERTIARAGLDALTFVTGWARIEAEQHYPSDVLAGAAIGHFFGAFFTEVALPPGSAISLQPDFALRADRVGLRLQVVY